MIGWFGIPGGPESQSTKTHVVINGKLLCGSKVGDKQRFQFCTYHIRTYCRWIECEKCKRIIMSDTCDTKRSYDTWSKAQQAANAMNRTSKIHQKPYGCPHCPKFHLTSQKKHKKPYRRHER